MWVVREKSNHKAVYVHTWSRERCLEWIEKYSESGIFTDKTLTKDSFEPFEKK